MQAAVVAAAAEAVQLHHCESGHSLTTLTLCLVLDSVFGAGCALHQQCIAVVGVTLHGCGASMWSVLARLCRELVTGICLV